MTSDSNAGERVSLELLEQLTSEVYSRSGQAAWARGNAQVQEAVEVARHRHMGQKYGDEPYMSHLHAVAGIVGYFLRDSPRDPNVALYPRHQILQAAYLHDVVEDTPTTLEWICGAFGPNVAYAVEFCTAPKGSRFAERVALWESFVGWEGFVGGYPGHCVHFGAYHGRTVKLADRIANLLSCRSLLESGYRVRVLDRYLEEHPGFVRAMSRMNILRYPESIHGRMVDVLEILVEQIQNLPSPSP